MSTIPRPPAIHAHETESHRIVRERAFVPSTLPRLLVALHDERATGTLVVEWNQGGIRAVHFREERRVTPDSEK
jgi:hypothetical protein